MYCSKCGSNLGISDNFCLRCDAEASSIYKNPMLATPPIKKVSNGMAKQFSKPVFILLIFIVAFAVALIFSVLGLGSVLLSDLLAKSIFPTAIGFALAKSITKNERRTWVEIIWFQVINFVGGIITFVAGAPALGLNTFVVSVLFPFLASSVLFWLQNRSNLVLK